MPSALLWVRLSPLGDVFLALSPLPYVPTVFLDPCRKLVMKSLVFLNPGVKLMMVSELGIVKMTFRSPFLGRHLGHHLESPLFFSSV